MMMPITQVLGVPFTGLSRLSTALPNEMMRSRPGCSGCLNPCQRATAMEPAGERDGQCLDVLGLAAARTDSQIKSFHLRVPSLRRHRHLSPTRSCLAR